MKKLILLLVAIGLFSVAQLKAQTLWNYNFGTGATTVKNATASSTYWTGPDFIPAPSTNGGESIARTGVQGGSITLSNPSNTNASLIMVGSTGGSPNKFLISGYTPSAVATTKFSIKFGTTGGSSIGYFNFIQGKIKTSGATSYTLGSRLETGDTFTGLRFQMGASGAITTGYKLGAAWTTFTGVTLVQGTTYEIEIYMNNTSSQTVYTRGGAQTIGSGKVDIWIDGVLRGNDLGGGDLALNAQMDSFAFFSESSTDNSAVMTLDDIVYSNYTAPTTLPVSFTSFTGKANGPAIDLSWATASEQNNKEFNLFRSADGSNFTKITTVNGSGTTSVAKNYSYSDTQPFPGINYYKLTQVDNDGNVSAFKDIIPVKSNATASNFKIVANRANSTVDLTIYAATEGNSPFVVYDLSGRRTVNTTLKLNKGYNNISVPAKNSADGLQIASLIIGTEVITNKFIQ